MSRVLGASPGAIVVNQDIYEVSATQKHRLGTRLVRGDCVYRYVKAGDTLDPDVAAWGYNAQMISYAAAPVAAAAGENQIYMTVGASDGPAADGALAAHYLQGGYVVIFSSTVATMVMQIKDNTVVASGGGTTLLTLDGAIPYAIATATSTMEASASPYIDVRTGNSGGYRPFVGAPMLAASTTYPYCWVKTWGPHWLAPQAAVGVTANNNNCVFRHDGSIDECDYSDSYNSPKAQHAGRVLTRVTANTQGAPFIFLEIAP